MSNLPTVNRFELNRKQTEAFQALKDPSVLVTLYGGAMGGGKSMLIAAFVLWSAFTYPDTRYLIGRQVFKDLMNTSVESLWKVARLMGVEEVLKAGFNQQRSRIDLPNRSVILFRQLDANGEDTYQDIGGLDLSMACIDEASQVDRVVYQTLLTRLRHNIPPHGPKLLACCNPTTSHWTYDIFDQHDKGLLPENVRYIHATQLDNDKLDPAFRATLKRENFTDEFIWESQILGNWRYEVGSNVIFHSSHIEDCFNWSTESVDQRDKFLTWDPAYGGEDRSVLMRWQGMVCEQVWIWTKRDANAQVADVKRIIAEHQIPMRNVSIDGIGSAALVSQFKGCVDHRANARPLDGQAFASLKDQLYFRLAEAISTRSIRFHTPEIKDALSEELLAHRSHRTGTDQNAAVTPKKEASRKLGEEP